MLVSTESEKNLSVSCLNRLPLGFAGNRHIQDFGFENVVNPPREWVYADSINTLWADSTLRNFYKGPQNNDRIQIPNFTSRATTNLTKIWIFHLRNTRRLGRVLNSFSFRPHLDGALMDSGVPTTVAGSTRLGARTNLLKAASQTRSKMRVVGRLTSARSWFQRRELIWPGNNWPSTNWVAAKIEIFGMNWMSTLAPYLQSERCKCWTLNT